MSEDEVFALTASAVFAVLLWYSWFAGLSGIAKRPEGGSERAWLWASPVVAALLLAGVLERFAASDVRDAPQYIALYFLMGLAWTGLAALFLSYLGLGIRDDVLERRNGAAAIAIAGAVVGIMLCFAGGNIGDGPGWWVVVACAALATGALFLLWTFLHRATGVADTVTIDRDGAAGLRSAGFFVGAGLILGRAVAGDWEGIGPALRDLVLKGWPALVLLALAVLFETKLRPSAEAPARPLSTHGAVPFFLYLAIAAGALRLAGPWS